jgi:hypothetical protein
MSSIRDAIIVDVVTQLSAAGKPAGLTVHRNRTRPIHADVLPAQLVYMIEEHIETGPGRSGYKTRRKMKLRIETRVDAGSSAPDAALDPYLSWMVQQLHADPTRGGRAHDSTEFLTQWTATEADKVYGAAASDWIIDYVTSASNPDAAT